MNLEQLRDLVVVPVLRELQMNSKAAMRLVIGTGLVESKYTHIKQVNGPALGFWQMEPKTHDDIWSSYLLYRLDIAKRLNNFHLDYKDSDQLIYNMKYACAMCRIHYWRSPMPLPDANDIEGLGRMWKLVYNTEQGKGTVEKFVNEAQEVLIL